MTALAVMARYPVMGEVKTRLGSVIGAERAYRLYCAFLQDIETRFGRGQRTLVWAFHPPESRFSGIVGPGTRCLPQTGRDLAERICNCFRALFLEGFTRVLMIGADVPHVRDEWLDEAEAALASADVVLGPSADGGYYLAALAAPHDLFRGVAMGTPDVLAQTLHRAEGAGLAVHLLPPSFDVDEAADLVRLQHFLRGSGYDGRLPQTHALLADWATSRGGDTA